MEDRSHLTLIYSKHSLCKENERWTDQLTDSSKAICAPFFEGGHNHIENHMSQIEPSGEMMCIGQVISDGQTDKSNG
uniref:Uncharacterized protein n=1 Tax=Magallana gigas TaxID=29159 RepID=K1Q6M8_MAGGI